MSETSIVQTNFEELGWGKDGITQASLFFPLAAVVKHRPGESYSQYLCSIVIVFQVIV